MAIAVEFSKERVEYLLQCLEHGNPIDAPDGKWLAQDMLALAGACFFGVMSQGPALRKDVDWSKVPAEHREAIEETLLGDIHAAIEWQAESTQLVRDAVNDETFESVHAAVITTDGSERKLYPVRGFR